MREVPTEQSPGRVTCLLGLQPQGDGETGIPNGCDPLGDASLMRPRQESRARRAKACLATRPPRYTTPRLGRWVGQERETVQVNSAKERSSPKERSWFLYRTPGDRLEGSWCPIALGTGACDSQRAGLQDTHDYVPSTLLLGLKSWSKVLCDLFRQRF